ncbi:MAG: hypothetical protein QGH45_13730 [Myxococcota bacterium]|nr:hypothetical protein [Myxococcota bacterium]
MLARRLAHLLRGHDRPVRHRRRLARLILELSGRPPPPDFAEDFPRFAELRDALDVSIAGDDGEVIEETFLELYTHLHQAETPYTADERARLDAAGGYWAHAGGLGPVLMAPDHLDQGSVSADFGAGNGLQALLFQLLAPHRKTIQIEISAGMVAVGRRLQSWFGIPGERVEWVVGDVIDHTPRGIDMLYLYRPVRPDGPGRAFYERFAQAVEEAPRPMTILSVADGLGVFLSDRFDVAYCDGHLTRYEGPRPG